VSERGALSRRPGILGTTMDSDFIRVFGDIFVCEHRFWYEVNRHRTYTTSGTHGRNIDLRYIPWIITEECSVCGKVRTRVED
jgi:hypothetical protein